MTALELRDAATHCLHLEGHPDDLTLIRGLLDLVDTAAAQVLEIRRQVELAAVPYQGGWAA